MEQHSGHLQVLITLGQKDGRVEQVLYTIWCFIFPYENILFYFTIDGQAVKTSQERFKGNVHFGKYA